VSWWSSAQSGLMMLKHRCQGVPWGGRSQERLSSTTLYILGWCDHPGVLLGGKVRWSVAWCVSDKQFPHGSVMRAQ
jgi:hypothetical protein